MNAFDYFILGFIANQGESRYTWSNRLRNDLEPLIKRGSARNEKEIFDKYSKEIKSVFNNSSAVFHKTSSSKGMTKIDFNDAYLAQFILRTLGDEDKNKILLSTIDEAKIIPKIMSENNLPQTSCYRMINELIKDGFFIITSQTIIDGRKIQKYQSLFANFQINIEKNKTRVYGLVPNHIYNSSELTKI